MTTMTDDERELVRQQSFDCAGAIDIDIELGCGSIEVRFADADTAAPVPDTGPTEQDAPSTQQNAGSSEQDAGSTQQDTG
ncbi:MAG: hypothetical protein ACRDV2_04640, partial [Actinomycetes bacterium]